MEKKRRADCFFGLHFDYHAVALTKHIGVFADARKFGEYLDRVKPDFVQFDSKGHPGYTSFLSEYGTQAPGLEVDELKMIREETKKRGILLFAHYSGMIDQLVCQQHPEWAATNKDGTKNHWVTDPDGPYYKEIMLPQLKELAGKYGLDGAWVDGECWFAEGDYSPELLKKFYEKTGFTEIEDDPASPSHVAFYKMLRERTIKFIEQYTEDMHEAYPEFEITSAHACGDIMPEKTLDCLDFYSGDAADPDVGVEARCFAVSGKTWDIMSWGHAGTWELPAHDFSFKPNGMRHLSYLCRDAATILAQGGAYQVVNSLTTQGEVRMTEVESMSRLAKFVRERQPFCQNAHPIRGAAIWASSEESVRHMKQHLFLRRHILFPACFSVLDGGRPVDFIFDQMILSGEIQDCPLVIIPEIEYIQPEYKEALMKYMENGGKVLACGAEICKAFTGVEEAEEMPIYVEDGIFMQGIIGKKIVTLPDDYEPLAVCHRDNMMPEAPLIRAAAWKKVGKGALYCIGWDIFSDYDATLSYVERDLIRAVLDQADPKPEAYLEKGVRRVEIVPTRKGQVHMVNLINRSEFYMEFLPHNLDDFPAIHDLTVAVKCAEKPEKIWFEPEHKALEFDYDGAYAHVKVPCLEIHGILVIE